MEDIFNMLSSTARIDKSKRKKKKKRRRNLVEKEHVKKEEDEDVSTGEDEDEDHDKEEGQQQQKSRDRTGKRDTSDEKLKQVHREQIAAFRRSMAIRLSNKHDPDVPDPIPSFHDLGSPSWWANGSNSSPNAAAAAAAVGGGSNFKNNSFQALWRPMLGNIEAGKWKDPTPIQMQSIPTILHRRDLIGAAPTGSGKSGAFLLPTLLLSSAPFDCFYHHHHGGSSTTINNNDNGNEDNVGKNNKKKKKSKSNNNNEHQEGNKKSSSSHEGEIRALVVAPTMELASQLHREVERLGMGKPGGVHSLLLSRSNASNVIAGSAGGKHGLDVLVTTPLRLVDCIERGGLRLDSVRVVVMDEVDRLFDAADGGGGAKASSKRGATPQDSSHSEDDEDEDSDSDDDDDGNRKKKRKKKSKQNKVGRGGNDKNNKQSGSAQTKSFLAQMDVILSQVPPTAVRALFSATVTPMVRSLAESALRNPVDVTIAAPGTYGGANTDIDQQLMFVGKEEGKLLAMRQLAQRGQLKPPVIVFTQSQDRAQALFAELLYDGIHVDVIHAGRSKAARDNAVAKFRRGDTWVLIATDLVARGVDFKSINMVINYDLPISGISYVHRIGRCGRAGRKGTAITLFTEADFENLRTIANVMKQSGCKVEDWMLNLKRNERKDKKNPRRYRIDTTPKYDRKRKRRKHNNDQARWDKGSQKSRK